MTTLTLPSSHRALTLRIASYFFRNRMNTNQIAEALSMPEAEIWNRMNLSHSIWREQEQENQNLAEVSNGEA